MLKKLLNVNETDRIVKCLWLFIDKNEYLSTIQCLCGNEILLKMLNFHKYYSEYHTNKLIDFIKNTIDTEDEENKISEIVNDEEIAKKNINKNNIIFISSKTIFIWVE